MVEHFFRHESAKLIAVLTRAFGFSRLDLVEDKVQESMLAAMQAWRQRGVPTNPAGWIYRVARNRILDALRREEAHQRALALSHQTEADVELLVTEWLSEDQLPDSLLRMIFVCCHPALDRRSQIAMTLKILCGFSLAEIARGLLVSTEAAKKRVQRAKKTLAQQQVEIDLPSSAHLQARLSVVQEVLYLMFNEGYSTSQGIEPLREDICEEAARLCHLLCEHRAFSTPSTRALMALMLFHASRLEARVDSQGAVVLLADQDRSKWDRQLIAVADSWLERSKGESPSRFHLEAAIARVHCQADCVSSTDWGLIVRLYDRLLALNPSPLYILNRAVARGESGEVDAALADLESIRTGRAMSNYSLLDCAAGRLHELADNDAAAREAYTAALSAAVAPHEQALLRKKLEQLLPDEPA
ncbi:MAG: sigma-70 family RNA polymerase sigma factor [Deltaproteobacteria bacterium]|nr:sigma-70 family RNA polymerase sigma factor [Deltaproteobacteria bacterium]